MHGESYESYLLSLPVNKRPACYKSTGHTVIYNGDKIFNLHGASDFIVQSYEGIEGIIEGKVRCAFPCFRCGKARSCKKMQMCRCCGEQVCTSCSSLQEGNVCREAGQTLQALTRCHLICNGCEIANVAHQMFYCFYCDDVVCNECTNHEQCLTCKIKFI